MYLSKLQNAFVQIEKRYCPNCKMYICLNPCLLLEVITQYIESLSNWMTLNAPHQYLKHFISIWAHSCLSSFHTLSLSWIEQSASELEISYYTLSLFLIEQSASVKLSSTRVRDFLPHTFIYECKGWDVWGLPPLEYKGLAKVTFIVVLIMPSYTWIDIRKVFERGLLSYLYLLLVFYLIIKVGTMWLSAKGHPLEWALYPSLHTWSVSRIHLFRSAFMRAPR